MPFIDHWEVVVSDRTLINELAQARDDQLSAEDPVADVLQTEFTMGPEVKYDQYHVQVVGRTLTRNLAARFEDVYDEIGCAFEDLVPLPAREWGSESKAGRSTSLFCDLFFLGGVTLGADSCALEWTSVRAFDMVIRVIARTGNRLFVSLPLCECRPSHARTRDRCSHSGTKAVATNTSTCPESGQWTSSCLHSSSTSCLESSNREWKNVTVCSFLWRDSSMRH